MDHELIKQKLYEHADGDYLSPEDQSLVRDHLASCRACADEMKLWKNLRAGLREMDIPRADESVSRAILREIVPERSRWRALPSAQVWATTLALAGLLIYSAIPYSGSAGSNETYLYASTGELGLEPILEGNSLEQAEPSNDHAHADLAAGEI